MLRCRNAIQLSKTVFLIPPGSFQPRLINHRERNASNPLGLGWFPCRKRIKYAWFFRRRSIDARSRCLFWTSCLVAPEISDFCEDSENFLRNGVENFDSNFLLLHFLLCCWPIFLNTWIIAYFLTRWPLLVSKIDNLYVINIHSYFICIVWTGKKSVALEFFP